MPKDVEILRMCKSSLQNFSTSCFKLNFIEGTKLETSAILVLI